MATLADAAAHRQAVDNLTTLATRDLMELWRTLDGADAERVVRALLARLPDVVELYGEMAGELGAGFYDDLREQADAPGRFSARIPEAPPADQVSALARWGVGPLFSAAPDPAGALSLLTGGLQRLVAGMDRGAVSASAVADPARPTWRRVPSAKCCAFCGMLATRGAVYGSRESAGASGPLSRGAHYHDHCRCTVVVEWPGQVGEFASASADYDLAYVNATREVGTNTSAVLAHMREALGTH